MHTVPSRRWAAQAPACRSSADPRAAKLRRAIAAYRDAIAASWHNQSRSFHERVADDAQVTLDRHEGVPSLVEGSVWVRPTLELAFREVCAELAIICISRFRRGRYPSSLAARREAAELLGIEYAELREVLR